jgi:tetratricopeptide (TPR) repeat protein
MAATLSAGEEAQLAQTIEMFEVITQSQPHDYQSLEILKEAYIKLGREEDVMSTSKRIAQAYVQMGQFSSAILEYETVLQRYPEDPDVQAALKEIEAKANNISMQPLMPEPVAPSVKPSAPGAKPAKKSPERNGTTEVEDGHKSLYKIFVEDKVITAGDFDLCWRTPDITAPPNGVLDPFIQTLADKGIMPSEKSLKLIADKTRLPYVPLDKYDIDIELARTFPAEICQRWCVMPFDRMSKSIMMVTANPFNQQVTRELAEVIPNRLLWYLAPPSEIVKNLRKVFR